MTWLELEEDAEYEEEEAMASAAEGTCTDLEELNSIGSLRWVVEGDVVEAVDGVAGVDGTVEMNGKAVGRKTEQTRRSMKKNYF